MKLGEALTVRARQASKLNDLQGRIKASVLVQEDTQPPENAESLLAEYLELSEDHERLVTAIQETNADTVMPYDGEICSLLDLLQQREGMIRERNIYGIAARAATPSMDVFRYSRSEIKQVAVINVGEYREKEDQVTRLITALDARIQQANWETDLINLDEPAAT